MYVDDQDEDVEEEEFHEAEEKHKTSQESVGSSGDGANSPVRDKNDDQQPQQPQQQQQQTTQPTQPEEICGEIKLEDAAVPESDGQKSSDKIVASETPEKTVKSSATATTSSEPLQVEQLSSACDDDKITNNAPVTDAVDDSNRNDDETPESVTSSREKNLDWADIMSGDQPQDSDPTTAEAPLSGTSPSVAEKDLQDAVVVSNDSIIDGIIKDTQDKLKIVEESTGSVDPIVEPKPEEATSLPEVSPQEASTSEGGDQAQSEQKDDEKGEVSVQVVDDKVVADGEVAADPEKSKSDEVEKKELDLDEDVKNPQYIPKKGVFYEHDDRSHDVEEKKPSISTKKDEDAVEAKETSTGKKTTSQDRQPESRRPNRRQRTDADRWNHDLFRGEKQKPKSKSELIDAHGYDIRQERGGRNQVDSRQPRVNNNSANVDRSHGSQDSQRSRQSKDGRTQRQNQPGNRSRERKPRRQNPAKSTQNRNEGAQGSDNRRDVTNSRTSRPDVKDPKGAVEEKHATPPTSSMPASSRRDQDGSSTSRNPRNDSRGRRKTSQDRPANSNDRMIPANTVMPPITTWSNEDMMKAGAFGKRSPPRVQPQNAPTTANSNNNNAQRDRSTDFWQQSQNNKSVGPDRPTRNQEDARHQGYNSWGRHQEHGDENHRQTHYMPRNHYNDRNNQHQDWNRVSNSSSYGKPNDYIVKTQTFENSRLSQANANRSANNRDLREVINERRMQGQQNFQNKVHHGVDHHANARGPAQGQLYHHQYPQSHHLMQQQPQQMIHNQQQAPPQHMIHHQPQQALAPHQQQHQQSQQQNQRHQQLPTSSQQQAPNPSQQQTPSSSQQQHQTTQQLQNHHQQPTTTQAQSHQSQSRQNVMNSVAADGNGQDSARLGASNSADIMNSRPIIKTDAYTGTGMHPQPMTQHSQNHRSMAGHMAQHNPAPATSHMVTSHLGAGASQTQYYTPSPGSRDPASAAAVATAYHGYMPAGHTVMDATRYHMASQQLADHGYMTSPGQANDVASGPVLHQQAIYPDTSAGGAVASSAYLTQPPGSTISPNTNIPVTGAGPQALPPVSYIPHSQYAPPPYSNPYSQPQHNQAPPQSGHTYNPYWTYI